MISAKAERLGEFYRDLDLWPMFNVVTAIIEAQQGAIQAAQAAAPALVAAIEALARTLRSGGRMAYAGAGSSGTIANLDAIELPGTFGIDANRVPVILAGGSDALVTMLAGAEDDAEAAEAAVDALGIGAADALIAVAASGTTPFTVAALRRASSRGALTVGIACVAGTALLSESYHAILIETPPEVVAGSTRMAAGTAQKCALNVLSTGIAVRLGHAYAGLMVNMSPDNLKLKRRAVAIVTQAADVDAVTAERALGEADWSLKTAVMLCLTSISAEEARARLVASAGDIRAALAGRPTT